MGVANVQEKALWKAIELIVDDDICPTKLRDKNFMRHICGGGVSYKTCLDGLIHLMWAVEELIAVKMKGTRGCILRDGCN